MLTGKIKISCSVLFLHSLLCLLHHPPPFLCPCLAEFLTGDLRINRFFIMSSRRGQRWTIGQCEIKRCPEETRSHSAGRMLRERLELWWEQASPTHCPAASILSIMFTCTHAAWAQTRVSERGAALHISLHRQHLGTLHEPYVSWFKYNELILTLMFLLFLRTELCGSVITIRCHFT